MRADIERLVTSRPSWRIVTDKTIRLLNEARDIAQREGDTLSVQTLDEMIQKRKQLIQQGLDPDMFD